MGEAAWSVAWQDAGLANRSRLLCRRGVEKQHKAAARNVLRHFWSELLSAYYFHLGIIAVMLFELVCRMTSHGVVTA